MNWILDDDIESTLNFLSVIIVVIQEYFQSLEIHIKILRWLQLTLKWVRKKVSHLYREKNRANDQGLAIKK